MFGSNVTIQLRMYAYSNCNTAKTVTVYVQIFEGCKFCGQPKSRIFAILFSWISCYHTLYFMCITTVL